MKIAYSNLMYKRLQDPGYRKVFNKCLDIFSKIPEEEVKSHTRMAAFGFINVPWYDNLDIENSSFQFAYEYHFENDFVHPGCVFFLDFTDSEVIDKFGLPQFVD